MMLQQIRNFILDMDGVLWRGDTPMPGLVALFATLDRLGLGYVLATNNATKTAATYTKKLAGFGLDIAPERILTSADVTAGYLQERYAPGTAVYVIGEAGLHTALSTKGFAILTTEAVLNGTRAPLVVVGFTRNARYDDFTAAALLIRGGATFIGTNPDPTLPSEIGQVPGAGALLALIITATEVEPTIIGKPSPIIFEEALKRLGGERHNSIMVGDRLSTDVAGAQAVGLPAILLLSGVTTRAAVEASQIKPEIILDDIATLSQALAEVHQPAHD